MQISYIMTKRDKLYGDKIVSRKNFGFILIPLRILSEIFGIAFLLMYIVSFAVSLNKAFAYLFYTSAILLVLITILQYIYKFRIRKIAASKIYNTILDLKIDEKGIYETSSYKSTFYSWECLKDIYNKNKYFIIRLEGFLVYIVKKDSIQGATPEAFYDTLQKYWEQYKSKNSNINNLNQ